MRTDILERKEEILAWIEEELTLYEIKTRLNCKYETLRAYLKQMGIEYTGQQSRKGQYKGGYAYRDSSYYTKPGAPKISSHKLKLKLIRDGVKSAHCELCGNATWLGKTLPLELHHIDENHYNNELENLQILCPNCHAISAPNAGAAIKHAVLTTEEQQQRAEHRKQKAREREQRRKQKLKEFEKLRAAHPDQIDSLGRFYPTILTTEDWLFRKELILNSGVDLMKYGFKTKLQEATGLTRRQVDDTIEHFMDDFKDKIYIRN